MDAAAPPTMLDKPTGAGRWFGFFAMCIGMFMAILDIQVVVTSLPVIEEALGIGADRMSWVQTAYLIAEVIAIPLTGLLTRVFSMRWLFVGALSLFIAASIGCATSVGFADLIVWRVAQGFAGGVLIPLVFSAIFLLFNKGLEQTVATTVGGVLAVLAPAFGPIVGGWITEHYSWHWLFLINIAPGILAVGLGFAALPRAGLQIGVLRLLDWLSLFAISIALAAFLIALKEAPDRGWPSATVLSLFAIVLAMSALVWTRPNPVIMFFLLRDRGLAFGCALSFLLGAVLFGSVYLMPVFLAFVRGHGPLDIGLIVIVTGAAQLVAAPFIVQIDRRFDARLLSAVGFAGFAAGLYMSTGQTVLTDYDGMFWPQVVRGAFVALCILPPIRFALGMIPLDRVGDASGLFNVSRNLGGAIGIALIDTVLFSRVADYSEQVMDALREDPATAARLLALTVDELPDPEDPSGLLGIMDLIEDASLTMALNDCWMMLTVFALLALPLLLALGPIRSAIPPRKLAQLASAAAANPPDKKN